MHFSNLEMTFLQANEQMPICTRVLIYKQAVPLVGKEGRIHRFISGGKQVITVHRSIRGVDPVAVMRRCATSEQLRKGLKYVELLEDGVFPKKYFTSLQTTLHARLRYIKFLEYMYYYTRMQGKIK